MRLPWSPRLEFPGAELVNWPGDSPLPHLFTVDVEEYFQVSAFEGTVDPGSWGSFPSRVRRQTDLLLELLAEHSTVATFFVVGWVARRHGDLVRRIREAGHEVASHGQMHRRVGDWDTKGFRCEVRDSKTLLEDLIGERVTGYRAPSFSIIPGREWALDILLDEGYLYDSSLFPITRPGYGHPGALGSPFWIPRTGGHLLELPMTTLRVAGVRLPSAGGAYFRHLPYALTSAALRRARPGVFYIHPWELDPGQPRLPVGAVTRGRHYGGIGRTVPRLRRLLSEFTFTSIEALGLERVGSPRPGRRPAAMIS